MTRTDTLFPFTTLFRSGCSFEVGLDDAAAGAAAGQRLQVDAPFGGDALGERAGLDAVARDRRCGRCCGGSGCGFGCGFGLCLGSRSRSEEHTSELQSLMRISYAVFCLEK